MPFKPTQVTRSGVFSCQAMIEDVFPLLCPKKEEDWIPGWECETIWSRSGFNEDGAIFRTAKPYGTKLYWNTVRCDIKHGLVEFLIVAPELYMFRFEITVKPDDAGGLSLRFVQTFTSVSEQGSAMLQQYAAEDFGQRIQALQGCMTKYLRGC